MPENALTPTDPALRRRIRRYALLLLAIAVTLAVWGEVSRVLAREALRKDSEAAATVTLATVHATHSDGGEELTLPGTVQAFMEAPIYARTSGYLRQWYTDIGAPVHKGQLLAEIDSPEIDQQLNQALADLATARANQKLAESTNERWKVLLATDSVSKQDAEDKAGDAAAKRAAADSAAANVARLHDLESFKRVVAPFDGIVTVRNTDAGALINAGQVSGTELFHIADMRKLRIYAHVPETFAALTGTGTEATLSFAQQAQKTYTAKVARTANALDPTTRTLQVELVLDNPQNLLLPGSYTEVHFKLPVNTGTWRLPSNTVLFRAAGLQVATVDGNQRIKLKNIVQGRDLGATIEVLSGINGDDVIVINPPDSLVDGTPVHVVTKTS